MIGRIKVFFDQKGYGFISADNGTDCFFHIKDTCTSVKPYVGMQVTFTIEMGAKGAVARNIQDVEVTPKKSFIRIGAERIKLSNIKSYAIVDNTYFLRAPDGIHFLRDSDGNFVSRVNGKLLIIDTFQGDHLQFYENCGIDVVEKCKELDELLCN